MFAEHVTDVLAIHFLDAVSSADRVQGSKVLDEDLVFLSIDCCVNVCGVRVCVGVC